MNDQDQAVVSGTVARQWMTWLALRHLLPATLLREVALAVVQAVGGERVAFKDLFDEVHSGVTLWNEVWMLRPRAVEGRTEVYLQQLVRSIAWQNDERGWAESTEYEGVQLQPALVDAIVRTGIMDFGALEISRELKSTRSTLQSEFGAFLEAFAVARATYGTSDSATFWGSLEPLFEPIEMPLRAIVVKHIADLCADADAWDKACLGYTKSAELFSDPGLVERWGAVTKAWKNISLQSEAEARGVLGSGELAVRTLEALGTTALADDPLAVSNVGLDLINLPPPGGNPFAIAPDRRVAVVASPLLHTLQDASPAIGYWLNGRYQDASRRFWALLRRQIASGASSESRTTRIWYARSLIEQFSEAESRDTSPTSFILAIRLLLESNRATAASRIAWSEALVDAHVSKEVIELVMSSADRHAGARVSRELVAVDLFRAWARKMSPSSRAEILLMWRHLADLAREFDATMHDATDIGRRSLRALREVAAERSEMRHEVASNVAEAVLAKLRGEGLFWGCSEAFETASVYADVFDAQTLERVTEAALDLLDKESTDSDRWPVVRPGLKFLTDETLRLHAIRNVELESRIIDCVLRLGTGLESEGARLLFQLRNFKPALLTSPAVRERLRNTVEEVRRHALNPNTSRVIENICALFAAPSACGSEALCDAFTGLESVLASAHGKVQSLGLAYGYDAILTLLENREEIETVLAGQKVWLHEQLAALAEQTIELWQVSARNPLVFAPFALPPSTRPNKVVVHNWAFASMRLAELKGQVEVLNNAFSLAGENPDLASGIRMAWATRGAERPDEAVDLETVRTDDRETFYSSLGRRLAQLHRISAEGSADLCKVLVEQCVRFGPRTVDVAVFLAAERLALVEHVQQLGLSDYMARAAEDRTLRLTLEPVVHLFSEPKQ